MGQKLGQHFLASPSILEKIAHAACPSGETLVLEIGPGMGALTALLVQRCPRVIAIELDATLIGGLRDRFPSLTLIESDVMAVDLAQWGPLTVCGNLPYYLTSPILDKTLALPPDVLHQAVFLIQKEVARRVVAQPGSRDYGFLSVRTQVRARAAILFDVGRGAFRPPPKVESAVIGLTPHAQPLVEDPGAFLAFAGLCFQQKRKTLRNNLSRLYPAIGSLPQATLRAEQLPIPELIALWRLLRQA